MSSPPSACILVWFLSILSCQRQRQSLLNVTQFVARHISASFPCLPFTVSSLFPRPAPPQPRPSPPFAHLSEAPLSQCLSFHLSQHQNFAAKALSHSSQARIPALIIYVSIPLAVFISHKKGFSWGEQALRIAPEPRKKTIRSEQYFTVPYKYKYN